MNELMHAAALGFICLTSVITSCYFITFVCSKAFFQAKLEYQVAFFKALNNDQRGGQ
jgi:hypothetical protein